MDDMCSPSVRRKNLCFIMQRYLLDNGFFKSADTLKEEAQLTDDLELCENIDLDGIYLEYAAYYQLKFGKYPKILRLMANPPAKLAANGKIRKTKSLTKAATEPPKEASENRELQIIVTPMNAGTNGDNATTPNFMNNNKNDVAAGKPAEPNPELVRLLEIEHGFGAGGGTFGSSQEFQILTDLVRSCIITNDIKLTWNDICGNKNIIEIVKEAVLVPIEYPKLFTHGLKPWKSVLIHGPPGTGKTHLAQILYSETRNKVTFFNVTSSIIISKWRGESEKILRVLFHLARQRAPSIIFFDEIEGLTSKRDRPTDHEASKRFKNEMLQMFDGLEQMNAGVFILASTNLPWEIDDAFLRRFEKKLIIELPNLHERTALINKLVTGTVKLSEKTIDSLAEKSKSFTGDEIRLACKEIAMQAVRLITKGMQPNETTMEIAFEQVKPLSIRSLPKHEEWQKQYGS